MINSCYQNKLPLDVSIYWYIEPMQQAWIIGAVLSNLIDNFGGASLEGWCTVYQYRKYHR